MSSTYQSISPATNARISTNSAFTITYTFGGGATGFDPNTVIVANVVFEEVPSSGDNIPTAFSVDTATSDTQIVITPSSDLKNDAVYQIVLLTSILDDGASPITEKTKSL